MLAIIILFPFLEFKPQDPVLNRILATLDTFRINYPQEKVYLQLDKLIYYRGEDIWFKGYTSFDSRPSVLSGVLYVELADQAGNIVERKMLPVFGGAAAGNLSLPKDITAGTYRIKAYTAWMKNFDPAFMFHRDIPVVTDASVGGTDQKDDTPFSVQFLPEGGNLVTNLTSFIAFKATDALGYPVDVKGEIVDDEGNRLNNLQTIHDGMGKFAITPKAGKQYFAVIKARGKEKKVALPKVSSSGVVLHIINKQVTDSANHRINYYVQKFDSSAEFNNLYLVVQMQGKPVDVEEIDFSSQRTPGAVQASGQINTEKFPEGVAQVTLFSGKKGIPLAERLVFIRKPHTPAVTLTVNASSFTARAKEEFTLSVDDTISGNYSVAVTDAGHVPYQEDDDNILSHFLLTSDIKGTVYHPGWYFRREDPRTLEALDLVMMTNGWRRYNWQKILDHHFPQLNYYLEKSIVVRGQAFIGKPEKKEYYKDGSLVLFVKTPHDEDSLDNMITLETDSLGLFSLKGLFFHHSASIYIVHSGGKPGKGRNKKKNAGEVVIPKVNVLFQQNLIDTMPMKTTLSVPFGQPGLTLHTEQVSNYARQAKEDQTYAQRRLDHVINLSTVTIKGKRMTHTDSLVRRYASPAFSGISGRTYDLTNNEVDRNDYANNALDYISNHVPGVVVLGDTRSSPIIYWRLRNKLMQGLTRDTYLENAPDFFLNEALLNSGPSGYDEAMNRLQMVKVADITLIRVFPPGFMVMAPGNAPHGAIAIYTRQGSDEPLRGPAMDLINLQGYAVEKEFYSPDYNTNASTLPDKRTTLYWNPYLIPDPESHQAHFSFFNSDSCKQFRIIIEGIGKNGQLVHLEKLITKN